MKSYLIIFHLALVLFGFIFVEHHLDTPGHSEARREALMSDGSDIAARMAAVGQINVAQAQTTTAREPKGAGGVPCALSLTSSWCCVKASAGPRDCSGAHAHFSLRTNG